MAPYELTVRFDAPSDTYSVTVTAEIGGTRRVYHEDGLPDWRIPTQADFRCRAEDALRRYA